MIRQQTVVSSTNVDKVVIEDGSPMMYVPSTGEASIAYSNGTSYTTSVTVPEDITLLGKHPLPIAMVPAIPRV